MAYVLPSHLELAIAFKVKLWINDFLGVAEAESPNPDVTIGSIARPREYVRAADILDIQTADTPAVAVGIAEYQDIHRQGAEMWATHMVDVAVRFGCAGGVATFEVGEGPRHYSSALANLFNEPQCRDLGSGIRLNDPPVVDVRHADPFPTRNGDQFAIATVTVAVDAPFADCTPLFNEPPPEVPAPGTPPRTPDEPVTILTLITSVEATP